MFPLVLDLRQRDCVVIGGGKVGQRKARVLSDQGANVHVFSLQARPADLPGNIAWNQAAYSPEQLSAAALVVASATLEVNRLVVSDAKSRGLWVTCTTEPELGNCLFPALHRHGPLLLAVSTSGQAPGIAQVVRDQLSAQLEDALLTWLDLLTEFRPVVLAQIPDPDVRRSLLREMCQPHWLERLRHETKAAVADAFAALLARHG